MNLYTYNNNLFLYLRHTVDLNGISNINFSIQIIPSFFRDSLKPLVVGVRKAHIEVCPAIPLALNSTVNW